jgi:hypothetical protein
MKGAKFGTVAPFKETDAYSVTQVDIMGAPIVLKNRIWISEQFLYLLGRIAFLEEAGDNPCFSYSGYLPKPINRLPAYRITKAIPGKIQRIG